MLHGARVLERKFAIEEHPFFDLTLRHAELCISSTFKSAFSPWGWAYTLGISQAPRAQWMMVSLQAFLCNSDVLVYQLLQVYWDKPKEYMWVLTPAERCGPDPEQNGRRPMVNLPGFCPHGQPIRDHAPNTTRPLPIQVAVVGMIYTQNNLHERSRDEMQRT